MWGFICLSFITLPILSLYLIIRIVRNKEDVNRIYERWGYSSNKKKLTSVIWIHAASIGEVNIALNLVKSLQQEITKYSFLITSCTLSSANFLKNQLPNDTFHQFVPFDEYFSVTRFLSNWKPVAGIFIESEIWPVLLCLASQKFPCILINARLSDSSYKVWKLAKYISLGIVPSILNKFSIILTQSPQDFDKFKYLKAKNVVNLGNIKVSNPIPHINNAKLKILKTKIKNRKVLLAVSTHVADEEQIFQTYKTLLHLFPELLLIIAPRHLNRVPHITRELQKYKLVSTTDHNNINSEVNCYIFNVIGELGTVLSIAYITFIGGSFKNGGHNLIEAAYFDTVIIIGPDMSNFQFITQQFIIKNAAIQIINQDTLFESVKLLLLTDYKNIKSYHNNAKSILNSYNNLMNEYINYLKRFI